MIKTAQAAKLVPALLHFPWIITRDLFGYLSRSVSLQISSIFILLLFLSIKFKSSRSKGIHLRSLVVLPTRKVGE